MSKNRKISGVILFSLGLIIALTGCTESQRYERFSKVDQSLSWVDKRERSFGDSDFSKIKTEKEAVDLLKEKYQVSIPAYYKETEKLINQIIPSETVKPGENIYSIFARNKELRFITSYPFYQEKELQIIAEVTFYYAYSVEKKQVYLKSQSVYVKIAQPGGKLPNDNLSDLILQLGKNMKIPEKTIENGLAGYEKRVKETVEPITIDYLPVVSNASGLKKNEEFLKEIAIVYDMSGTVREVNTEITDKMIQEVE
ncbi:hypothetical protein IGJ55_000311 [Enterococcus sp. AZ170]|uniref:hypothetical protein n=1 Tax=Enterococcus sp. AZ170 TaxID=2774747 RepID=UPI003D2FAD6F